MIRRRLLDPGKCPKCGAQLSYVWLEEADDGEILDITCERYWGGCGASLSGKLSIDVSLEEE